MSPPSLTALGLTILGHPPVQWLGERAALLELSSGQETLLSRAEPGFSPVRPLPRQGRGLWARPRGRRGGRAAAAGGRCRPVPAAGRQRGLRRPRASRWL